MASMENFFHAHILLRIPAQLEASLKRQQNINIEFYHLEVIKWVFFTLNVKTRESRKEREKPGTTMRKD